MAQGFIWPLLLPIAAEGACLSRSFDVRSGADHRRGVSSFLSFRTSPSKCAASSSSLDALETNSYCRSLCSLANSTANDAAVRHSKPWWSFLAINTRSSSRPMRRPRSNSSEADDLEAKRIEKFPNPPDADYRTYALICQSLFLACSILESAQA